MEENCYTVYMHKNKMNNKVYIGITCQNINDRWRKGYGYKSCKLFYKAIKKYGFDNFEHIILYTNLTKEQAEEKEIKLIEQYKSNSKNYGYNICSGGSGTPNHKVNFEIRQKISKATRKAMQNNELRKKISESHRGENHVNYGKHLLDKTKEKISKANKGKKRTIEQRKNISDGVKKQVRYHKKILCIETREIFNSIKEVKEKYNYNENTIYHACSGLRKKAYDLHWKYF